MAMSWLNASSPWATTSNRSPTGHHVAHLERLAVVDQELHHHLQGRPLPLEHAGDGDQRLHQGRAEGVDLAEHLAVALAA